MDLSLNFLASRNILFKGRMDELWAIILVFSLHNFIDDYQFLQLMIFSFKQVALKERCVTVPLSNKLEIVHNFVVLSSGICQPFITN